MTCLNREHQKLRQRDAATDPWLAPLTSLGNGSHELLVPSRGRVARVVITPTPAATFEAHRKLFTAAPSSKAVSATGKASAQSANAAQTSGPQPTARVGVNKEFFRQLRAIMRIIVPGSTAKEVWMIAAHTGFLLLRTWLSLLVAKLDGKLVGDLVSSKHAGQSAPAGT